MNTQTTTRKTKDLMWASVAAFGGDLKDEHEAETERPTYLGRNPRVSLAVPILRALSEFADPVDAVTLRARVLQRCGLDTDSARFVNFHAWALVDLQNAGLVLSRKEGNRKVYGLPNSIKTIIGVMSMLKQQEAWEAEA